MAQLSLTKSAGGILIPTTPDTSDYLNRLKVGSVISADFKKVRNPLFHRKYFSLLGLGYHYWEPVGGAISQNEKTFALGFVSFASNYVGHKDTLTAIFEEYISETGRMRATNVSGAKSFDAFRRWVTIESGHYDSFVMPDGSTHKEARSVSFANMDEMEFGDLYKSTLDVLWNFILRKTFVCYQAAENAAYQLLEYAA